MADCGNYRLPLAKWVFFVRNVFRSVIFAFVGIDLNVTLLVVWHIILVEYSLDGAFGNTCLAIDTLVRMNIDHLVAVDFIKTLYGANNNTIGVSAPITGFGYNVSHGFFLFRPSGETNKNAILIKAAKSNRIQSLVKLSISPIWGWSRLDLLKNRFSHWARPAWHDPQPCLAGFLYQI